MRQCGDPVPNQFPRVEPPGPARIAIVAQSPGQEEDYWGTPLIGPSGQFLDSALEHVGLTRSQCFVGNVCQRRPEHNHFDRFDWNGPEVQEGIAQLKRDLEKFQPTMVLCLGNEALHLFKHGNVAPPRAKGAFDFPSNVGKWRGSLFESEWLSGALGGVATLRRMQEPGLKCLSTFHPAAVVREYSLQAYVRADLERLREEAKTRELVLPQRVIEIAEPGGWTVEKVLERLTELRATKRPLGADIEGTPVNITCIAFANDPLRGFVIPFAHIDGTSVWTEDEEIRLWQGIKELLEDPQVPKVGQDFARYDSFALAWGLAIVTRNLHDHILSWWELEPELRKGLDAQASLLTKEPFYKPDKEEGELKFASDQEFWRYNGIDACVSLECWQRQMERMSAGQRSHYQFNRELIPAVTYMELRGIKWDKEKAREMQEGAAGEVYKLQAMIDREAARTAQKDNGLLFELYHQEEGPEAWFAGLVLACLGGKNPRRKTKVVEERWQPMRWNGKKWVKDGKIQTTLPILGRVADLEPTYEQCNEEYGGVWLKPMPRTLSKLLSFTPQTLAELEDHILESKAEEWKRVKQIWKEIKKHDQQSTSSEPDGSALSENDSLNVGSGVLGQSSETASDRRVRHSAGDCVGRYRPSQASLGELSLLLSLAINTGSTSQGGDAQVFLYDLCGLPRIFKHERTGDYSRESERDYKRRSSGEKITPPSERKICTDQQAIDRLYAETQDVRVLWVLQQRRLKKVITDLDTEVDGDSRLRASISLVKETGRMAESGSSLGTGLNRQALNKDLRCVCVADSPDHELGQFDLEGADSWTVAAELAAVGDMTMLEDLRAGLKPAKILCLLYHIGEQVNEWERPRIKIAIKETVLPDWLYPGAKSSLHGTSYQMGWKTMIETILKFSMADLPLDLGQTKPIVLAKAQVEKLQGLVFKRYAGLRLWHAKEGKVLMSKGYVEMSPGHVRRFHGRKVEIVRGQRVPNHDTLKELLASKPQFYTTWATKKALWRLWYDEENRRGDGGLVVEPLIAVHDALVLQWLKQDRPFAVRKIKDWFNNPVEIAGQTLTIPFEGQIGPNWGMKPCEKF